MMYCTLALDWPVANAGTSITVMRYSGGYFGTILVRTRSITASWLCFRCEGSTRRT